MIDIGCGEKLGIKGLKGFKSKKSFISYLEDNQKNGRLHKNIDPEKAWKIIEKHTSTPKAKESKKNN
jgi:rubredoxin